ncbi:MAG TPA: hypothetical protein G4O01_06115 [Dehalococcoidia bacterium]|nr:hypothetical protein [Dehalococcoidia bacterium]
MEERLIKKLMTSLKCESCGQNYEVYDIDILGHREDLWFMRVSCSVCHTQCLVAAIVREADRSGAAAGPGGVERDEARGEGIGEEDVLAMRQFLKSFDGDFARLFGQGR